LTFIDFGPAKNIALGSDKSLFSIALCKEGMKFSSAVGKHWWSLKM